MLRALRITGVYFKESGEQANFEFFVGACLSIENSVLGTWGRSDPYC